MYRNNLKPINITEFTPDMTVYIRDLKGFNQPLVLCQFERYEKGRVIGRVLPFTEKEIHITVHPGDEMGAPLAKCALYGSVTSNSHFWWFKASGFAITPSEFQQAPEENEQTHPSFGILNVTTPHGGERPLFGSSVMHRNTVVFKISHAELHRSMNLDRHYSTDEIIQIEMSRSQFVDVMSSINGAGVPVTITHLHQKPVEPTPYESKRAIYQKEFSEKMDNLALQMDGVMQGVRTVLDKPSLTKKDREFIIEQYNSLRMQIKSNTPFIADQFAKQMDMTIGEAKAEIEGFFDSRIRALGLEAFGDEIKKMISGYEAPQLEGESDEHTG